MKTKTRKNGIPENVLTSEAELKRLLARSKEKYLFAYNDYVCRGILFNAASFVPSYALWAMPLADIIKKRKPLKGVVKKLKRAVR